MLPVGLDLCIAYHSSKRNNTKCMDLVSHGAPVFRSTQRHMINRVYLCEDAVLHRPHRSLLYRTRFLGHKFVSCGGPE